MSADIGDPNLEMALKTARACFVAAALLAGCAELPQILEGVAKGLHEANAAQARAAEANARAAAPDLVLFFVSGHSDLHPLTDPLPAAYPYLAREGTAGPNITSFLASQGYKVRAQHYVDHLYDANGYGGYLSLLHDLSSTERAWGRFGTRLIVVAHSHGGVWAHAAIEGSPDIEITCLVDLDTSSFGWGDAHPGVPFADPRNRYAEPQAAAVGDYPGTPLDISPYADLEDVVSQNVLYELEVRSGAPALGIAEWFDERWNTRHGGDTDGLSRYLSPIPSHSGVAQPGAALEYVKHWLLERLGGPNGASAW